MGPTGWYDLRRVRGTAPYQDILGLKNLGLVQPQKYGARMANAARELPPLHSISDTRARRRDRREQFAGTVTATDLRFHSGEGRAY